VWAIGVARTGNMIGLSAENFATLAPAVQASRLENARDALLAAGAHEVIDSVADCESAVDAIEARIHKGERP
jgi:phosphonoacetaldehyde hydrolase